MRARSRVAIVFVFGAAIAVGVAVSRWDPFEFILQELRRESPHQRYARSLAESGLARTALATEWLVAARRALQNPVALPIPFTEEALLDPTRPISLGYAVTLKRGQALNVRVVIETDVPAQVFVDLFEPTSDRESIRRPVASAREGELLLSHDARHSGVHVLRIQTELLRGGHLRVTSVPAPSLHFPVLGGGAANIQSVYGDVRDAGRRSHEGVDIFAPRGTPVLAASDGVVMEVGENRLGGRVVWVWSPARGVRLYYAHLQDQLVRTGTFVRAGDTVGTVGNSGNARTTAPHLHFGIYARGEGAVDPDAFIRPVDGTPPNANLKTSALGEWARTRGAVALRASPVTTAPVVEMLPRASPVRVEGTLGSWVRTSSPVHGNAFILARELDVRRIAVTQ